MKIFNKIIWALLFALSVFFASVSLGLVLHLKWFLLIPSLFGWGTVMHFALPKITELLFKIFPTKDEGDN